MVSASLVKFDGDRLRQCVDVVATFPRRDGGVDRAKAQKKLIEAFGMNTKELLQVTGPCADQFQDRTVYGSCAARGGDKPIEISFTENWYRFSDVFSDDAVMKQCLQMGGKWKAVSRDSPEYRRAKLEQNADRLQNNFDDMKKMQADSDRALKRAMRDLE